MQFLLTKGKKGSAIQNTYVGVGVLDGVGVGVADCDGDGVGEPVGLGVGVEVGVRVGVDVDEPLKTTLGLWLLISVIVKLLVVSWTVKVSVILFWELTVKLACPFWAWIVTGDEEPLILAVESLDARVIVRLSLTDAVFLLQSRM